MDEENNISGGANESAMYQNGTQELSFNFDKINSAIVNPNLHIGKEGSHPTTSKFFQGDMHEMIIYFEDNGSEVITIAERLKIQFFLAAKYGTSLSTDYTDSQ